MLKLEHPPTPLGCVNAPWMMQVCHHFQHTSMAFHVRHLLSDYWQCLATAAVKDAYRHWHKRMALPVVEPLFTEHLDGPKNFVVGCISIKRRTSGGVKVPSSPLPPSGAKMVPSPRQLFFP